MDLSFIIRSTIGEEIDQLPFVPEHIKYEKLNGAQCAFVYGSWGYIILQLIALGTVDIWDAQYNLLRRIELECGIDKPFTEFHNAVFNYNITDWKNSPRQYNKAGFGGISAGPYLYNKVTFEAGRYRTTDFHCKDEFLTPFAKAYPKVDIMMDTCEGKEFAQVDTPVPHKGIAGAVLRQLLNVKLRNGILSTHYYGKVTEFFTQAFEVMDPPQIIVPAALSNEWLEKAQEVEAIIQNEYNEPLTLPDLARRVAINVTYLQRAFTARYQTPVMKYLSLTRIEKAKQYLLDTTSDIETIAASTQFYDAAHLSKAFKSATGHTPTEFRNYWLR